jgi:hypothetical protein
MLKSGDMVIYTKPSSYGTGSIPINAKGIVLKFFQNNETAKALILFEKYGKAIVPQSTLSQDNEESQ